MVNGKRQTKDAFVKDLSKGANATQKKEAFQATLVLLRAEHSQGEKIAKGKATFAQLAQAYTDAHLHEPVRVPSDDGQTMITLSGCVDWQRGRNGSR